MVKSSRHRKIVGAAVLLFSSIASTQPVSAQEVDAADPPPTSDEEGMCETFEFPPEALWSSGGPDTSEPVAFTMPDGEYTVTLTSADDRHAADYQPEQGNESWKLEGLDADGNVVMSTLAITDLPADETEKTETVGSFPFAGVVSIRAKHAQDEDGPNSITPVRAELSSGDCGAAGSDKLEVEFENGGASADNPFLCDGVVKVGGHINGFNDDEMVQVDFNGAGSPTEFSAIEGSRVFDWVCPPGDDVIEFTATGLESGFTISFTFYTVVVPEDERPVSDPPISPEQQFLIEDDLIETIRGAIDPIQLGLRNEEMGTAPSQLKIEVGGGQPGWWCLESEDLPSERKFASVHIRRCSSSPGQQWEYDPSTRELTVFNRCLDVKNAASGNKVPVRARNCNQSKAQKWDFMVPLAGGPGGEIRTDDGRCLDVRDGLSQARIDSVQSKPFKFGIQVYECRVATDPVNLAQHWSRDTAAKSSVVRVNERPTLNLDTSALSTEQQNFVQDGVDAWRNAFVTDCIEINVSTTSNPELVTSDLVVTARSLPGASVGQYVLNPGGQNEIQMDFSKSTPQFRARTVVHEIGHAFGLQHRVADKRPLGVLLFDGTQMDYRRTYRPTALLADARQVESLHSCP